MRVYLDLPVSPRPGFSSLSPSSNIRGARGEGLWLPLPRSYFVDLRVGPSGHDHRRPRLGRAARGQYLVGRDRLQPSEHPFGRLWRDVQAAVAARATIIAMPVCAVNGVAHRGEEDVERHAG